MSAEVDHDKIHRNLAAVDQMIGQYDWRKTRGRKFNPRPERCVDSAPLTQQNRRADSAPRLANVIPLHRP